VIDGVVVGKRLCILTAYGGMLGCVVPVSAFPRYGRFDYYTGRLTKLQSEAQRTIDVPSPYRYGMFGLSLFYV
jgi:hypothetical protein